MFDTPVCSEVCVVAYNGFTIAGSPRSRTSGCAERSIFGPLNGCSVQNIRYGLATEVCPTVYACDASIPPTSFHGTVTSPPRVNRTRFSGDDAESS